MPLYARAAQPTHRQPEPPEGLEEFEQRVMASSAFRTVLADRAPAGARRGGGGFWSRALLRYVRRLERDVGEGGFW